MQTLHGANEWERESGRILCCKMICSTAQRVKSNTQHSLVSFESIYNHVQLYVHMAVQLSLVSFHFKIFFVLFFDTVHQVYGIRIEWKKKFTNEIVSISWIFISIGKSLCGKLNATNRFYTTQRKTKKIGDCVTIIPMPKIVEPNEKEKKKKKFKGYRIDWESINWNCFQLKMRAALPFSLYHFLFCGTHISCSSAHSRRSINCMFLTFVLMTSNRLNNMHCIWVIGCAIRGTNMSLVWQPFMYW